MNSYEIQNYYKSSKYNPLYDEIKFQICQLIDLNCDWDNIMIYYEKFIDDIIHDIKLENIIKLSEEFNNCCSSEYLDVTKSIDYRKEMLNDNQRINRTIK